MNASLCTTFFLQMASPDELKPKPLPDTLTIIECEEPQYQLNRFLYELIGNSWEWGDLNSWTDDQWRALVESGDHRTWVAYYRGSIAGYYELHRPDGANAEIRYFGLTPNVIGKGFGGPLLSHAIESAWSWPGTQRVWVHTCTLDHPSALSNYLARGLKVYREEHSPT
ncbi:GNAT family N-acetyltransferase [Nitrincola sp. MINF-07-Sa-05]|uniref:GNAT family N-acetyltransferase n=1 Tax=Nitrincola salilacus TaxID=3400273 RepID=UPI0039184C4C